jgi:superfamily II DNA or RNA helicase
MDVNNTDFPISITNKFKKILEEYDPKKEFLKHYQFITKEYFINSEPKFRGLLLYYEVGMGKTFLAASVADYYRTLDTRRKIIILSPKSLASNFYDTILKYMVDVKGITKQQAQLHIDEHYRFVSSNASNMIQRLQNISSTEKGRKDDKPFRNIEYQMNKIIESNKSGGFLENSLVIIDECHNVFNAIVNGSKIAVELYDMILNTKDIKLLFLTGTPIVNTPFELVPCVNMLFGTSILPEIEEEFNEYFIDEVKLDIKNKNLFKNYLVGKVSYYGEKFTSPKETKEQYAEEFPMIAEEVNMSQYQYSKYSEARVTELREAQRKNKSIPSRFGTASNKKASTYRIQTRQISNFVFPENIYNEYDKKFEEAKSNKDPKEIRKIRKKLKHNMVNDLTKNDLSIQSLKIYSPKMLKILDNINKEMLKGNMIGLVYSEFVTGEGVNVFSRVLDSLGWHKFDAKEYDVSEITNTSGGSYSESDQDFYDLYTFSKKQTNEMSDKYGGKNKKKSSPKKQKPVSDKQKPASDKLSHASDKLSHASDKISLANISKGNYTYAVISGDVPQEHRNTIRDAINSPDNISGKIINILLFSSTGSEGLNLKGVRHVHIMEPYWHMSRIFQVKARGRRLLGHAHLAKSERTIQSYVYISVYPSNMALGKNITEPTTDKYIYNRALKGQVLVDNSGIVVIESSIDCAINKSRTDNIVSKSIHCRLCRPTNKKLYHLNLHEDLNIPNTCIELENDDLSNLAEQITAKELVLEGGKKVYYTIDPPKDGENILSRIHVYEFREDLGSHVPLKAESPYYPQILEKIMDIVDK